MHKPFFQLKFTCPNRSGTRDRFGDGGWFQDDSRTFHLLCALSLISSSWSDRRYQSVAQVGDPWTQLIMETVTILRIESILLKKTINKSIWNVSWFPDFQQSSSLVCNHSPWSHTPRSHSTHSASVSGQAQACVLRHFLPWQTQASQKSHIAPCNQRTRKINLCRLAGCSHCSPKATARLTCIQPPSNVQGRRGCTDTCTAFSSPEANNAPSTSNFFTNSYLQDTNLSYKSEEKEAGKLYTYSKYQSSK